MYLRSPAGHSFMQVLLYKRYPSMHNTQSFYDEGVHTLQLFTFIMHKSIPRLKFLESVSIHTLSCCQEYYFSQAFRGFFLLQLIAKGEMYK